VIRFHNPPIVLSVEMSLPILQAEHSPLDVVAQPSALTTILEVKSVGMPYKVIWTIDKGLVTRKITVSKAKKFQEDDTERELSQSDDFADDFRARCAALPPFPPPEKSSCGTAEARWQISGPATGPSRLPIST
jgi:hypothetical protein